MCVTCQRVSTAHGNWLCRNIILCDEVGNVLWKCVPLLDKPRLEIWRVTFRRVNSQSKHAVSCPSVHQSSSRMSIHERQITRAHSSCSNKCVYIPGSLHFFFCLQICCRMNWQPGNRLAKPSSPEPHKSRPLRKCLDLEDKWWPVCVDIDSVEWE